MLWLNKTVDEIIDRFPEGEILIESGHSPSGTYHLGHMRELVTSDALLLELRRRGRKAKHISFVDDLDALRKIPVNVPSNYEKYLGKSLCDIPSPAGEGSYADYFLAGLKEACSLLGIEVEFVHSHKKYREGFFVPAIEKALDNVDKAKEVLETISGRKLGEDWSPIQVSEDGYLKKRAFVSIDTTTQTIDYLDKDGAKQTTSYAKGEVKLDWRLDWPARWWLLDVNVEPFGRDHATKGGSYDTGAELVIKIFGSKPPLPVPYDFINLAGDTKKMSASKGTGLDAAEAAKVMPAEVWRYFILSPPPSKRLYFDPVNGVVQLMDEFAELIAKPIKTEAEQQLIYICTRGSDRRTLSSVPFSHLVASYQSALRDPAKTIDIISRTEHGNITDEQKAVIEKELAFIDKWLDKWAPEDAKFELRKSIETKDFTEAEKEYLAALASKIEAAPKDADGEWFHKAIYELKEASGLSSEQVFKPLYKALIGKDSGPRAGWFLSILPRDWLIKRLRLES